MAQYWHTEYPFAFIEGLNRYDLPYSLKYNDEPLAVGDELLSVHISDAESSGAVHYIKYIVAAVTGDVYLAQGVYCSQNDTSYFICNWGNVFTSKSSFSITIQKKIIYYDGEYTESTVYTPTTYTYDTKSCYYKWLDIADTHSLSGTAILGYTNASVSNEMSAADWLLFNPNSSGKPEKWAWVLLYGDNVYTNDPYNRPPDDDPEARGGNGDWDNSSDTITVDAMPAGLWGQGFISVYCPTVGELQTFATEIWRDSNREHLNDIFPQGVASGIVSCHTIPVAPTVTTSGIITVGGYPIANTSANILANRFIAADFGNLSLKEYFGAFSDYLNTKLALYLPYIGFVPLAPEMVINASVNLSYKIDCFTGDCIAILTTNRADKFNYQGMSYMFAGNCATQIPITSQTGAGTSDIISTAVSGLAGLATNIVTGNPIGAVAGTINTVNSIMADTSKIGFSMRGGFSGAKGQLANQRAYIIINRPVMENGANNNYFELCGIPSSDFTTVGSNSGFVQAMEVKLADSDFANATENEKNEILTALKGGIYL